MSQKQSELANSIKMIIADETLLQGDVAYRIAKFIAHRDKLIEARARLNTLEDLECDWHSLNSLLREIAKAIKKTEAEIKRLEGEGE